MRWKKIELAKFDKNGNRKVTFLACEYTDEQKQEMYADGFVDLSEEDWNYYVGNMGTGDNGTGYIRDKATGKPVSAPPAPAPSLDTQIEQLNADYSKARFELGTYYMEAVLNGDVGTQKEIKAELDSMKAQFDTDVAELIGEVE